MSAAGAWSDLGPRFASAAVLAVVGVAALWLGEHWFLVLAMVCAAILWWELSRMCGAVDAVPYMLGVMAAVLLFFSSRFGGVWPAGLLLLVSVFCTPAVPERRILWLLYAPVILLGGYAMLFLRGAGFSVTLWVVLVVIVSDLAGYFVGRSVGGPKFWPRISPKKTWSGTVAGWVAAFLVGLGFWAWGEGSGAGGLGFLWASPLLAFAGQMGDIAESAVKRRAGVKDSSNLIPGHGGLMDRLDALLAAALALFVVLAVVRSMLTA